MAVAWDDTKLQLKQPNLFFAMWYHLQTLLKSIQCLHAIWTIKTTEYFYVNKSAVMTQFQLNDNSIQDCTINLHYSVFTRTIEG